MSWQPLTIEMQPYTYLCVAKPFICRAPLDKSVLIQENVLRNLFIGGKRGGGTLLYIIIAHFGGNRRLAYGSF